MCPRIWCRDTQCGLVAVYLVALNISLKFVIAERIMPREDLLFADTTLCSPLSSDQLFLIRVNLY
jgi:hypothetical protein